MRIHIVQKGDTLFEIAKQYGVDFEELVKLNSQLSSPDMIMPGMKIKVPGESKQVRSSTDKATRTAPTKADRMPDKEKRVIPMEKAEVSPGRDKKVEKEGRPVERKTIDTRPRPIERPIGKEVSDDRVEPKKIEPKVPKEVYPVRPIMQPPKMPSRMKYEDMPKEVRGVQPEMDAPYMMPERDSVHPRPMREPLPVHQAMNQAMHYYYPMNQQMSNTCHCCSCCSCRRGPSMQGCNCNQRQNQRSNYYNCQPSTYNQNMPYYYQQGYQMY